MISKYVEGYTTRADFCPFCTAQIVTRNFQGMNTCDDCGTKFYVIIEQEDEA